MLRTGKQNSEKRSKKRKEERIRFICKSDLTAFLHDGAHLENPNLSGQDLVLQNFVG